MTHLILQLLMVGELPKHQSIHTSMQVVGQHQGAHLTEQQSLRHRHFCQFGGASAEVDLGQNHTCLPIFLLGLIVLTRSIEIKGVQRFLVYIIVYIYIYISKGHNIESPLLKLKRKICNCNVFLAEKSQIFHQTSKGNDDHLHDLFNFHPVRRRKSVFNSTQGMIVGSNISHQKTIIFVYVVNKSIHLMIIVRNEVQLCLSINARYVSSNLAIAILDPIKFRQTSGSYRINPHFLCLSCYQAYIYHFLSLASIHPHFAGTSGEDCVGLCSKDCKYSYLLSIK